MSTAVKSRSQTISCEIDAGLLDAYAPKALPLVDRSIRMAAYVTDELAPVIQAAIDENGGNMPICLTISISLYKRW